MSRKLHLLAVGTLGLLVGCADGGRSPTDVRPEEAWLDVRLESPNADDGAVLFTISGVDVLAVDGLANYAEARPRDDRSGTTVVVLGDLASGPVARVKVAGTSPGTSSRASILQVARRDTHQQRPLEGYGIALGSD